MRKWIRVNIMGEPKDRYNITIKDIERWQKIEDRKELFEIIFGIFGTTALIIIVFGLLGISL